MSGLRIQGACVSLGAPPIRILHDISLEAEAGEILVLLGASGSGKTTLLRSINRLVQLEGGSIEVAGRDIAGLDPVALRLSTGYVLQGAALFPHWTVAQNIATVPRLVGWDPVRTTRRVDELLELVRLDPAEYRDRFPESLSGGQQQRVGVARALAVEPGLVLLDEPFGALDALTREGLQSDFQELQRSLGFTVVLVTHDVSEALRLGNRIAILSRGRVVQTGAPAEILRNPATADVEELLTTPRRQAEAWKAVLAP